MSYVFACSVSEVGPGQARLFITDPEPIAIFNVGGRFFATQDKCPHGQFSLSESYVEGDRVVCALHDGCFSISSGKRLGPPVSRALRTFQVEVRGDAVFVDPASGDYVARVGAGSDDGAR
jgi:nitrite reductase/ring-hydroxylating ferredoxin subunit